MSTTMTARISRRSRRRLPSVSRFGSSTKLIDGGFAFENDHRLASEVLREPAEGFDVENPAYDATPTSLLDEIVTDEGVQELE